MCHNRISTALSRVTPEALSDICHSEGLAIYRSKEHSPMLEQEQQVPFPQLQASQSPKQYLFIYKTLSAQ